MPRVLKVSSSAKLNLYLEILDKRPDGYHNLRTVFERISLSDTITLKEIGTPEIKIIRIPKRSLATAVIWLIRRRKSSKRIWGLKKAWRSGSRR